MVSSLGYDGVYALTITVFAIHCCLLCYYVDGWRHRVAQRMHSLNTMKQVLISARDVF